MLHPHGIHPEAFEVIKFAVLVIEYVNHDIHVIYQRPQFAALNMIRALAAFLFHCHINGIGDRFDLYGALGFAKDKEVGNRFVYLAKVERHNGLAFLFLNGAEDGFKQFTGARKAGGALLTGLQGGDYFLQIPVMIYLCRTLRRLI